MNGIKQKPVIAPKWVWLALLVVCCLFCVPGVRAEDEGGGGMFGTDMQVDGGILDFIKDKKAVVIRNYAVLTFGTTKIRARNMVYYYESKEVYAEGDVSFDRPDGNSLFCDKLFFSLLDYRGTAENIRGKVQPQMIVPAEGEGETHRVSSTRENLTGAGRAKSDKDMGAMGMPNRMVIHADRLQSINRDHQEGVRVSMTPSLFAKPHWKIVSSAMNFRRGEKVESWNNVVKVGNIPVFWIPYFIKDLKYDWPWMRVGYGHSSDWGNYGLLRLGLDLDPDPADVFRADKLFFDFDYRQDRGWAFGGEFDYLTGRSWSDGVISFYHLKETNIGDSEDMERAKDDNELSDYRDYPNWEPDLYGEKDRWAFDWMHTQRFNDRWTLQMESHTYSDRDFRREYMEWDYKEGRDPVTSLDLRYEPGNWQMELIAEKRTNDWITQAEYLPELRISVPGLRIGGTSLYWSNDTRVGYINKRFDTALDRYNELNDLDPQPGLDGRDNYGGYFRFHTDNRLNMPFALGGIASVTPYVGYKATFYGSKYGDDGNVFDGDKNEWNTAALWGANMSTRFFGTFNNGNMMHIIEPSLQFDAAENPTFSSYEIYQVDSVDSYIPRSFHKFTFAVNQKFLVKDGDGAGTRELVDFDLSVDYFPVEDEAEFYQGGDRVGDISLDFIMRPNDSVVLFGDAKYDPYDGRFNDLGLGVRTSLFDKRFNFHVTHRYERGDDSEVNYYRNDVINRYDTEQTVIGFGGPLWNKDSKYSLEYSMTYQWEDNPDVDHGLVEQAITLRRDIDTFWLEMSLERDEEENDTGVYINLIPKGWVGVPRDTSTSTASHREVASRYANPEVGEGRWSGPEDEDYNSGSADNSGEAVDGEGDSKLEKIPESAPFVPDEPAPKQ